MRLLVLLLVLACLAPALAAPADRRAFALEVLRECDPSGFEVIEQYETSPWSFKLPDRSISMSKGDFMAFVPGRSEVEIVCDLVTAVHEECHNYARKMVWPMLERAHEKWRDSVALPVRLGVVFLVPVTETFPAREAAARIPKSLRNVRYQTYVDSPNPNETTQKSGVFGLLDEFNAYQQGTRAGVDVEAWLARHAPQTADTWLSWLRAVEPVYYARAEFKLFILAWLATAKERHPSAYRAFLGNREAVRAFVRIDDEYAATIRRYLAARAARLDALRKQGLEVLAEGRSIRIGSNGIGTGDAEYAAFQVEVARPVYVALEREVRKAAGR
jgi:hypothetical protein